VSSPTGVAGLFPNRVADVGQLRGHELMQPRQVIALTEDQGQFVRCIVRVQDDTVDQSFGNKVLAFRNEFAINRDNDGTVRGVVLLWLLCRVLFFFFLL